MALLNYRVNLGFAGLPNGALSDFAAGNILCMTGNVSFPTPMVSMTELGALLTTFNTNKANSAPGGVVLTALTKASRIALITALRKNAAYVQSVAGQNLTVLLSSGYQANSTNRTQSMLDVPNVLALFTEMTGTLTARLQPVSNARAYQVRYNIGDGPWSAIQDSSQARRIVIPGLVAGTTVNVQGRAVGGSTGYSNWSPSMAQMVN